MARVTFRRDNDDHNGQSRSVPAPKHAAELWAWFKACRLALPIIPNPYTPDKEWFISNAVATISAIVFEMHSKYGERALVIVDRNSNTMGY